jgi:hypothetical protein
MVKEHKRTLLDKVTKGPGWDALEQVVLSLFKAGEPPHIPVFGNGYRSYPVRVTGIRFLGAGPYCQIDIEGVLDYRDYKKGQSGARVVIREYLPSTRKGNIADIFDKI